MLAHIVIPFDISIIAWIQTWYRETNVTNSALCAASGYLRLERLRAAPPCAPPAVDMV